MKYYAIRKGHHAGIICGEWKKVQPQIMKEIKGYPSPEWKGFDTKAEAEQYMGQVENVQDEETVNIQENEVQDKEDALADEFKFTSDAVVFIDGSLNFCNKDFDGKKPNRTLNKDKNYYFSAYGVIIFFRDGSTYVETARVDDGDKISSDKPYITVNHHGITIDALGNVSQTTEFAEQAEYEQRCKKSENVEFDDKYVLSGWQISAELESAKRALDICFHEKNLDSAYLFYDCNLIDNLKENIKKGLQGKKIASNSNVTYNYDMFCEKIYGENKTVGTKHVYSHDKAKKRNVARVEKHELFNSCVDALAKSETYNKPIDSVTENKPLKPYGVVKFDDELTYVDGLDKNKIKEVTDARRRKAFELVINAVTDKTVRPEFI